MGTTDNNKALVRRFRLEMCGKGIIELADELFASRIIITGQSYPPTEGTPEFFKQMVSFWHTSFPDSYVIVDNILAEGDKVVDFWRWGGTHKVEFWGIPPTNKKAEVAGASIYRIVEGKIVEFWSIWDRLGLLEMLDALPEKVTWDLD